MEYLGVFAFIMVISYMGLPGKVNHLETKVKRLNKVLLINNKGESIMSKLINDLVGKKCVIKSDIGLEMFSNDMIECKVLEADEDWIKIEYNEKKGNLVTMLMRVDNIDNVEILDENNNEKQ